MIYLFRCEDCGLEHKYHASIKQGPPPDTACWACDGGTLARVWTPVNFICDSDPDYIAPDKRVFDTTDRRSETVKEGAFQKHIDQRRALVREAGHNPNTMRMTHSVPADLFHGKKRETGDPFYWDDPSNLKKHSSCKVD